MSDERDDDDSRIAGWIIALAVVVAIVVSLWMGMWGALGFGAGSNSDVKQAAAPLITTTPAATGAAVAMSAPAAAGVAAPTAAPTGNVETVKVYFDVNKFEPPASTSNDLDALVTYARSGSNTKLGLSGYHDKTGDPTKNAALSKDRAMAVRNVLISAGVPEDRIMLQKPTELTGDLADNREARRVDVFMLQ
jgi:K(+)-stimulated pyrophosphate-energized sodium pump